ncbi:MAG: hypothetical protein WB988_23970, partial [Candidatus Nitrosopolaris sp.]
MIEELKSETETTAIEVAKPSNAGLFVSYRVPPNDFAEFQRIAILVHKQGFLKAPTVTALAKACLYTQCNLYLEGERKNLEIIEYDKKMKQLQAMTGP